jgi:hypothetical protein
MQFLDKKKSADSPEKESKEIEIELELTERKNGKFCLFPPKVIEIKEKNA